MIELKQWTVIAFMPKAISHKNFTTVISKYNNYYCPIN